VPPPGALAPPGMHPSRMAILGATGGASPTMGSGGGSPAAVGLSGGVALGVTRSAEEAQLDPNGTFGPDGLAKKPRIERPEGHLYSVSCSSHRPSFICRREFGYHRRMIGSVCIP
jgi:hypothetical protein